VGGEGGVGVAYSAPPPAAGAERSACQCPFVLFPSQLLLPLFSPHFLTLPTLLTLLTAGPGWGQGEGAT